MADEIITELWQIKDRIAKEQGYDIEKLVAYLASRERPAGQRVVDLCAQRRAADRDAWGDRHQAR